MANTRRYSRNISESKARLDAELVQCAAQIGHHGVRNFVEMVRQRCRCAITDEYARDLLARAGYQEPKP